MAILEQALVAAVENELAYATACACDNRPMTVAVDQTDEHHMQVMQERLL